MKKMNLLFGLSLLAVSFVAMGCEDDTTDTACDPACGENATCDTSLDTPACKCNDGFKFNAAGDTCITTCPTEDPCGTFGDATCAESDTGANCACAAGSVFRTSAAGGTCVAFETVLVLNQGGVDVASATEGTDVDAIGVKKGAAATAWCAAAADVKLHNGPGGDVDAAHQTPGAVVGAPDGDANTAATYFSTGLPTGDDKGWISCKFPATIAKDDVVQVSEVTGANDADEPFDVLVCYEQLEADATVPCVKIGSEAKGDLGGGANFTVFDFPVTDLAEGTIPAGLPAAE